MWGAGHMIRVVSPIIFWFPQMCHLSVQLQSSAGQTIRPDCRRQKGSRHRRFAAASRSLRCHGTDVTEAWFFSLQREKDRRRRRQRISGAVNYLLKTSRLIPLSLKLHARFLGTWHQNHPFYLVLFQELNPHSSLRSHNSFPISYIIIIY